MKKDSMLWSSFEMDKIQKIQRMRSNMGLRDRTSQFKLHALPLQPGFTSPLTDGDRHRLVEFVLMLVPLVLRLP